MGHFYAGIHGNRGPATRLGTKSSGITAFVNGWHTGVRVHIYHDEDSGEDVVTITRTTGSGYGDCPGLAIRYTANGPARVSGEVEKL